MLVNIQPRYAKPAFGSVQVDWGHPLTAFLKHAWMFNEGGGLGINNLVLPERTSAIRINADTGFVVGSRGIAFQSGAQQGNAASDNTGFGTTRTSGLTSTSVSVACGVRINTTNGFLENVFGVTNTGGAIFVTRPASTDISPTLCYKNVSPNGFLFVADSSGLAVGANTATAPAAGVEYDLVGTYTRDTTVATFGGTWKTYLNGLRDGTDNNFNLAGTFGGTFSDVTMKIGDNPQWGASAFPNGNAHMFFRYLYVWARPLSSGEISYLQAEPYAFLRPIPAMRYWSIPSAVVEGTTGTHVLYLMRAA